MERKPRLVKRVAGALARVVSIRHDQNFVSTYKVASVEPDVHRVGVRFSQPFRYQNDRHVTTLPLMVIWSRHRSPVVMKHFEPIEALLGVCGIFERFLVDMFL